MSDYIKREDARDAILNEFDGDIRYKMTVDEFVSNAIRVLNDIPTVDAVPVVRCKDYKYFEYNHFEKMDGFLVPLIVAHEICTKWGNGCKTSENGYCFMGERKESK